MLSVHRDILKGFMVRAERIELSTLWLKARCSTTELRPHTPEMCGKTKIFYYTIGKDGRK
jgi:hypothetical protein